jgi:hypothetical protein
LNKQEWRDSENSSFKDAVEEKFAAYFMRHRDLWDKMDEHQKMMISSGVRQRSVMEGMLMEAITCEQWLKRIVEKYGPASTTT